MKLKAMKKFCTGGLLFALICSTSAIPIYQSYDPVEVDYDFMSLKEDFDDHPYVADIRSNIEGSLSLSSPTEAPNTVSDNIKERIEDAMSDLDALTKLLEVHSKYIEAREREDPAWPVSLATKLSSGSATEEENFLFHESMHHLISGVVIMKMMEERVSITNKYVDEKLKKHPLELLDDEDVKISVERYMLKSTQTTLHTLNQMIDEAFQKGSVIFPSTKPDQLVTPSPSRPHKTDTDVSLGIGAFMVLLFSAIGFFFVLFGIVYGCLKGIKKCSELISVVEKKSKYQQI